MTHGTHTTAFSPAWWLPGGHTQTLYRKFAPTDSVEHHRERIELDDGDFIDLDWAADAPVGNKASDTVVFILHGLCGCSQSAYVLSLQALLSKNDVPSVVMNFRGCSGEINRKAKAYHSGISEDVNEVFSKLSAKYSDKNFAFVGYSLGANVLLKWMGEIKSHSRIKKIAAVSTPFSLSNCSRAMLKGASQLYGKYFVWRLKNDLQKKLEYFKTQKIDDQLTILESLEDFSKAKTIWEFDELVTAPLHDFNDAQDYYLKCSSERYIENIQVDTLLIQSKNDPLIPAITLPQVQSLPDNIHLHLENAGGHVGFIEGYRDKWLEQQILQYLIG